MITSEDIPKVPESTPIEKRTIASNEVVSIALTGNERADIIGGEEVGTIHLGGLKDGDENLPTEVIKIIAVNNLDDPAYQDLVRRAIEAGSTPSKTVLLALHESSGVKGSAFLSPGKQYTLGRQGNIKWFDYGVATEKPQDWTPFDDNLSISRNQLTAYVTENKATFIGVSENSATTIESPKFVEAFKPVL